MFISWTSPARSTETIPAVIGLQHRLDERAAFGELPVGADERRGLLFDLPGHAIEGAVEQADFVGSGATLDPQGIIAAADLARRGDEVGQRMHLPIGKSQGEPHGEPDEREREREQGDVELQLPARGAWPVSAS